MQMEIIDTNENYDSLDMLNEVQLDHMVKIQIYQFLLKVEVSLSEPVLKNNFELIIKVLREHKI